MDEDFYNRMMSEEHERIEREAKTATRGCGLLALIVALIVTAIIILYKLFNV